MRKFSRELEPHPPDAQIVAQFLSVAEWPRLEALLNKLAREQCEAGSRYAWFVQVALQRIHGLSLADVRERRAQLQIAGQAPQTKPDAVVQQALDLQAELRQAAAAKAMR
ncbi:MAG: hypothetical protein ACRD4O_10365 [Bryobacteraceae bacterium]